ncbi:magnesium and cobalt efflux protein CorC [Holospora obtusa F1]|uniref:Magnesium and cobalt efflux protein CorC n=1 Tax=Holospora obtusa F1 TaxID=1399147 RepID=W6TDI8_HOLOB|nr:transporter associated domain-containing protein [Holospora obtusa]ETZ06806.1 magnesium and cobalt efflux protein CorC [Holospora obtusa F1]
MNFLRHIMNYFSDAQQSVKDETLEGTMERFFSLPVEDIMIPRSDIQAVSYRLPFSEITSTFLKTGFRWLPVYRETLDNISGVISIHSVLALKEACSQDVRWYRHLNHASFAPASMTIHEMMEVLYKHHGVALFIVDEHGGIQGMVTKGHILKEFSSMHLSLSSEEEVSVISRNPWVLRGRMSLEDFEEELQIFTLFSTEEKDRISTLGGWLCYILGRVPLKGEVIQHASGFSFEIQRADPRKIYEVCILNYPNQGNRELASTQNFQEV